MDVSTAIARLTAKRCAILREIWASARAHEMEEGRKKEGEALRRDLLEIEFGEPVCAAWHPEGYDGARHYLETWAPEATADLADVPDDLLHEAWGRCDMFSDCAIAAIKGAADAVRILLRRAHAREQDEVP